jgi:aspartate/methionine/tyrosine aminotransferase
MSNSRRIVAVIAGRIAARCTPTPPQQHRSFPMIPSRFPANDIISLVGAPPRHDLAESFGPSLDAAALLRSAAEAVQDLALGYGSAPGHAALREAIAAAHDVDPAQVVVTVGGMHALFLLAFTLCSRGDEAVVAAPVFPLAHNVLLGVGATVKTLPLHFDDAYQPDLDALRALLTPKTRLVSLASPQNPSGVALPPATLAAIAALVQQHAPQAWLLVDETYREATFGAAPVARSAVHLGPRVVGVASLSKCHGTPGLRIGWAITRDAALREQLVTAKFNTVISCSPLDEALARQVLRQPLAARRDGLAANLAVTADWVQRERARLQWVRPDAGALCCVRLRPDVFDDAAVARFHAALPVHGVRVGRGPWFGEADRVFRLGFGLQAPDDLRTALGAVSAALDPV